MYYTFLNEYVKTNVLLHSNCTDIIYKYYNKGTKFRTIKHSKPKINVNDL